MRCQCCGSERQAQFGTEIAIHSKNFNKPQAFIFTDILICMNCGKPEFDAEFRIGDSELSILASGDGAARRPMRAERHKDVSRIAFLPHRA